MRAENRTASRTKTVILVLAALLLLSAVALTVRIFVLQANARATVVVQDNQIGSDPVTGSGSGSLPRQGAPADGDGRTSSISLYWFNTHDNERFNVSNMLPGDTVTQYFNVSVTHRAAATLTFGATLVSQTNNLADVLNICVTLLDTNTVLYNGPFANVDAAGYAVQLPDGGSSGAVLRYRVDVSLPGSAGNEYQMSQLTADLYWQLAAQEGGTGSSASSSSGSSSSTPDSGSYPDSTPTGGEQSPDTGDTSALPLWFGLMVAALVLLIPAAELYFGRKGEHYAK